MRHSQDNAISSSAQREVKESLDAESDAEWEASVIKSSGPEIDASWVALANQDQDFEAATS